MTSRHSDEELTSTLVSASEERQKLANKAKNFDLTAPITEEEFDDSLQALGAYLLTGTRWDTVTSKKFNKLPVVDSIPMICKTSECPFYNICPIMAKSTPIEQDELIGTKCRVDRHQGVEIFASLARDLDISPDQTVDLLAVANLVRLMIYRRRIDWQISLDSITINPVVSTNPITGETYTEIKAHPLLREAERFDKMIDNANKNLVASRKDRLTMATQIGKNQDALKSIFLRANNKTILPPSNEPREE